jgi:hypothetical protein
MRPSLSLVHHAAMLGTALLLGCGGGGGGPSDSPDGDSNKNDGSMPGTTCQANPLDSIAAAPTSYALPAPRCNVSFDAAASNGNVAYSLLDLTNDGRSDIVVYEDQCDTTVGQSHWDVYAAGDSGFAAAPSPYTLPAPRCATSFNAAAGAGAVSYSLFDVNDDGRPDLVVTTDQCDTTVGQTHWDAYLGGASGFAAAPSSYAVPAPRCQVDFDALGGDGSLGYAVMDLDGDGRDEIVVYKDNCDTTVGVSHWDVYRASNAGFAAAPTSFSIPAARCQVAFDQLESGGNVTFQLLDLDGDARLDLVVMQDLCDTTVGATHWDRYAGGTTGFTAAPSSFSIPAARCQQSFNTASSTGQVSYSLLAQTCAAPSLIVTQDMCDAGVGVSRWDIYDGSATGFAAAPRSVTIPAPRCQSDFDALDGDGQVDWLWTSLASASNRSLIVVSDQCSSDVGQSHWDLYSTN